MPSRADRRRLELALRAVALGALAVLAWRAFAPRGARVRAVALPAEALGRTLVTMPLGADTLVAQPGRALDARERDLLATRRDAGQPVAWRARGTSAAALGVEPALDPAGGVSIVVATAPGDTVRLGDSVGVLDSARVTGAGVRLATARPVGLAHARVGASDLVARAPAAVVPKAVVVLARAGWEGKFVVAALEERGFTVEARLTVRPDTAVVQGRALALDTARVGVVVALDASAGPQAAAIAAFVRAGGGLVLAPGAAEVPALATLAPGTPGARRPAAAIAVSAGAPRRALPLVPLAALAPGAVALERRDDAVAVAARRLEAGRVLYVGYEDSWRWRMTGPDGAQAAHRRWWAGVVAAAAPEPRADATLEAAGGVPVADAPLARTIATLGPPTAGAAPLPEPAPAPRDWPWGAVALAALVGEWASRRLRGAP